MQLSDAPWSGGEILTDAVPEDTQLLPAAAPSKIVCVGRNYAAHAKELGNEVPDFPLLFLKPPSSLIAHGEAIRLPAISERVDFEGELAVIVGRRLKDGDEAAAKDAVFGYTAANDVTARDLQRKDVQFTRGKGFDTFCPLGPSITRGLDVSDLRVQARVDDERFQDGRTSHMMWSPLSLLVTISHIMTLEPGDVVLTGTPPGVAPLRDGDVVAVSIEGLEPLANPVKA